MEFKNFSGMLEEMTSAFEKYFTLSPCELGSDADIRWPKLLPLMRFDVHQYKAVGFGNIFSMVTNAMGGVMRLLTFVCTPSAGTDVPLLLVDVMAMGKKRAVFIEYYDCTASGAKMAKLDGIAKEYSYVSDYSEKDAWYISERTPYSLIKGGTDEKVLTEMLVESISAYAEECTSHKNVNESNKVKLQSFVDRMVKDGNPSYGTLNRVFGKEGAEKFFRTRVMPVEYVVD